MKKIFRYLISSGLHSDLDEGMKVAIQVSNADALLTATTLFIYAIQGYFQRIYPLNYFHSVGFLIVVGGFLLIRYHHYDLGRFIIHLNGLLLIFATGDMLEPGSGSDYYYMISFTIPFVAFSLSEYWKGLILSLIAAGVLVFQEYVGPGFFFPTNPLPPFMRLESIVIVILYLTAIFAVARWQLTQSQKSVSEKQRELIQQSGLIALGEMSGGIAHEINNPLQSIALQTEFLKRELQKKEGPGPRALEIVKSLEATGMRIGKMVKGLKDLSRDVYLDSPEIFEFKRALDDVLAISQERLWQKGISVSVTGETNLVIKGSPVQISQVFMNLLNNSIDAVEKVSDKWIKIEVSRSGGNLIFSMTDSGEIISDEVAGKMLRPFFTTKEPSKGTGLGLSISSSIVGKHGGRLFYDPSSVYTRFIVELPLAT